MNMNLTVRSIVAMLCVMGPLWLTTHLPSESAFAVQQNLSQFFGWQGALVLGSVLMSLLMARLFVTRL
jgi:hypothetical protein